MMCAALLWHAVSPTLGFAFDCFTLLGYSSWSAIAADLLIELITTCLQDSPSHCDSQYVLALSLTPVSVPLMAVILWLSYTGRPAGKGAAEAAVHWRNEGQEDGPGENRRAEARPAGKEAARTEKCPSRAAEAGGVIQPTARTREWTG